MTIRMASPLYIVRQDCEKDLFAVLRRLAEVGFDGIEFLGFFGHGAKEVRQKLDERCHVKTIHTSRGVGYMFRHEEKR